MTRPRVTAVLLTRARPAKGLLGYVSCTVAGLRLDGLTLRRTRQGRLAVSFPCRRDGHGRKHPIVRPGDGSLARAILAALRRQGALPSQERRQRARSLVRGAHIQRARQDAKQAPAELGFVHGGKGTAPGGAR